MNDKFKPIKLLKTDKQRYTLGIVFEPDVIDAHNDYADTETIEKACWEFTKEIQAGRNLSNYLIDLINGIKAAIDKGECEIDVTEILENIEKLDSPLGWMHCYWNDDLGEIVENYIAPVDFELNGQKVRKGTWLIGIVWHEAIFQQIEDGMYEGLSLGGTAVKVPEEE